MTLGEKLLLLRRRLGWTQRELAAAARLNLNTVARIERNEIRDPSGQVILRLALALETSTDYLLGRNEEETNGLWPSGAAVLDKSPAPGDTGYRHAIPRAL